MKFLLVVLLICSAARAADEDPAVKGKCGKEVLGKMHKYLDGVDDAKIYSVEPEKGAPALYDVQFYADGKKGKAVVRIDYYETCRGLEVATDSHHPESLPDDDGVNPLHKPAICFSKRAGIKLPKICFEHPKEGKDE